MKITKFGHSCLLVEEASARVLFDPGKWSSGFEALVGLTAVCITHQHADHLDAEKVSKLLDANPSAQVYADEGAAQDLGAAGIAATVVAAGTRFDAGVPVEVLGTGHAPIHPDIRPIGNVGYLLADSFFHPGDAIEVLDERIEVLAIPAVAPWMRASETVDYLRAVAPRTAIPIHEAVASMPEMYHRYLRDLGPDGTNLVVPNGRTPVDV
ncbi:hypothetical protein MLP_52170 [Microlunatus phosphovorus NM-1]|uniref:Metallo-beta-lactamase domain-containing protein n=2 Tax=Microlunatus phosphovorus TaxID=29405 RepID=F5XIJ3_MICPN|nr:hypothetical protein MLP_52170 [Microlunatus phosphovorus NM-1]